MIENDRGLLATTQDEQRGLPERAQRRRRGASGTGSSSSAIPPGFRGLWLRKLKASHEHPVHHRKPLVIRPHDDRPAFWTNAHLIPVRHPDPVTVCRDHLEWSKRTCLQMFFQLLSGHKRPASTSSASPRSHNRMKLRVDCLRSPSSVLRLLLRGGVLRAGDRPRANQK